MEKIKGALAPALVLYFETGGTREIRTGRERKGAKKSTFKPWKEESEILIIFVRHFSSHILNSFNGWNRKTISFKLL